LGFLFSRREQKGNKVLFFNFFFRNQKVVVVVVRGKEKKTKKEIYLPQLAASIARLLQVGLGVVRPVQAGAEGPQGGNTDAPWQQVLGERHGSMGWQAEELDWPVAPKVVRPGPQGVAGAHPEVQ